MHATRTKPVKPTPYMKAYLVTRPWLARARQYWDRNPREVCFCCSTNDELMLFHRSETTVGREKDEDLVPICLNCMAVVEARMRTGTMRHNVHFAVARQMRHRASLRARETPPQTPDRSIIPPWEDGSAS